MHPKKLHEVPFEPRPEHLGGHWCTMHPFLQVRTQVSIGFRDPFLYNCLCYRYGLKEGFKTKNIKVKHAHDVAAKFQQVTPISIHENVPDYEEAGHLPSQFLFGFQTKQAKFSCRKLDLDLMDQKDVQEYLDQHLATHAQQKVLPGPKTF